jgi:hypothetical protein
MEMAAYRFAEQRTNKRRAIKIIRKIVFGLRRTGLERPASIRAESADNISAELSVPGFNRVDACLCGDGVTP